MSCSCFHTENRLSGILNELIKNGFLIIKFLVFKLGESPHSDNIAVGSHYRNGFQNVFRFFTVHNYAPLGFQLPGTLINVEHHRIHSQVHSGFLGTQSRAQAGIKKHH